MVSLFVEWYKEINGIENAEDCYSAFSKLSLLKLLFLIASVKTDATKEDSDLLDIFDNFTALPYGPVEGDVYSSIILNTIPKFTIGDRFIEVKKGEDVSIGKDLRLRVRKSVEALKKKNENLINIKAFDLVEITHRWKSWSDTYAFAEFLGQKGYKMKIDEIRNEPNQFFGN